MAEIQRAARHVYQITVILVSVWSLTVCSQQFIITHAPHYVTFLPSADSISNSEISKVVTLGLGFSPKKDLQWNGLQQGSVFHKPKANVLFTVEGFTDSSMKLSIPSIVKYNTVGDVPMPDSESIVNSIQSATFSKEPLVVDFSTDNTILDLKSHYPKLFNKLPATLMDVQTMLSEQALVRTALNITNQADLLFLGELHVVNQIVQMLKEKPDIVKDSSPDVYNLHLSGLRKLVETHGAQSAHVAEALTILNKFFQEITEQFKQLYGGHVIVEVVTLSGVEESVVRRSRSLMQAPPPSPAGQTLEKRINVADDYDENYPAIFNIILWTMVILMIAIFAISICTWFMDPGRDSIIYRMTAQRLKKD